MTQGRWIFPAGLIREGQLPKVPQLGTIEKGAPCFSLRLISNWPLASWSIT